MGMCATFRLVVAFVLATLPFAGPTLPRPILAAHLSAVALREAGCGVQRWAVKTLTDADVGFVDFTPVATTVADLVAHPEPDSRPPNSRVAPVELTTYTLTANLVEAKLEPDRDIHLVISDLNDPEQTMIVELPDAPNCAPDADPHLIRQMQAARDAFIAALGEPPSRSWMALSGRAQITGVGFFDFIHGQRGIARNGIELHPVLRFQLQETTTANSRQEQG